MAGDYQKPITIQRAIENIVTRKYLLPAIQRKFEWDIDRICVLFDSIMRGYPINTLMLWEITSAPLKRNFKFYQFLEKYCERFAEDNPDFPTVGHGDFYAVIDGQQRLTSIYIGLKGTYANKLPRKHFPKVQDDSVFPPRRLYLNIKKALDEDRNEEMMQYDFQFLTDQEFANQSDNAIWFLVGDILDFDDAEDLSSVPDVVQSYLHTIGQAGNEFARHTLTKLYQKVRRDPLIHYYSESNQSIDHVLNIFVRTNHGGKPLAFGDLLMSIAVANWKQDARQQIDQLIKNVWQSPNMGFAISRDWVLKAALAITDVDIRFKVENFSHSTVENIERDWESIKACILSTFRLLNLLGLDDVSLRAKNAAIPVAYYLYHKRSDDQPNRRRYEDINNLTKCVDDRQLIAQWLMMSLLRGVFGGQGDALLASLRKIIKDNLNSVDFPLHKIIEAFKGSNKDLLFDDAFIARILKTEKNDPSCYLILALLMPDRICTNVLHKDHLHPAAAFTTARLDDQPFLSGQPDLYQFFQDPTNWDTIANLHLLDDALNKSKNDQPLEQWVAEHSVSLSTLMIPTGTSLAMKDFPSFVGARGKALHLVLKKLGTVGKVNATVPP